MDLRAKEPHGEAPSHEQPLTDHAYDGIAEYDSPLPKWWVWIFWGTFYFALAYIVHYHLTGNGPNVASSYEQEMSSFREQQAMMAMGSEITDASLQSLANDAALMADAKTTFTTYCVQCHAARGEGNIGPNLTDGHWLHGDGSALGIYQTVKSGVTGRGMPAWDRQLRPVELGKVAAYVYAMRGTNLPGKPPQGKLIQGSSLTAP